MGRVKQHLDIIKAEYNKVGLFFKILMILLAIPGIPTILIIGIALGITIIIMFIGISLGKMIINPVKWIYKKIFK